jgi:hypothetical protein
VRDPDSPDGTHSGEEPPGRPDLAVSAEPAEAAAPAPSDAASEAAVEVAARPGGGAQPGSAQAAADSATKTLDKVETADRAALAAATNPGRRLAGRASAALAPLARGWRRVRARPTGPSSGQAATAPVAGEAAGSALARLTALPAILIAAWLLPGLPLLLGGSFLPVPMLLISVPLAAALTVNGLREVPATWPRSGPARTAPARAWPAWFGLLATVAVVTGLIAWQIRESSQSLIVLRDAGTYLQAGYWAAQHGGMAIAQQATAFGGAHQGLVFASNGFLSRGSSLFPAVTPGMPMLIAAGFWIHGITGALAVGPILGGLAALSFAGLVARLVGPQWAPAGALVLGVSLPQQYISRSTLSETALQVVLFGGLCLLADSMLARSAFRPAPADLSGPADPAAADGAAQRVSPLRRLAAPATWAVWLTPERVLAGLAGLALGFGLLLSLDALLYLLPAIPFAALLLISRRPQGVPFLIGLALGAAYGLAGMYVLDRPFLDTVGGTVAIAGVAAVWLLALSVVAGQLTRLPSVRRAVPAWLAKIPLRWLPEIGGLVTVAALTVFAIRPYVQTVRGHPSAAMATFIAGLQRAQGLPVDPGRLYSEQTLYWVIWYIGLPTLLLGGVAVAALVCNCLRALLTWRDPDLRWRLWALPIAIVCAGSAVVLWAPDIAPDQPWASQRLAVIALPGLILGACWAAAWLTVRARSRGAGAATAALVGLFCTAAMLVPTVATTFGIGISHSGSKGGLKPVAQGLALQRTGEGETAAVSALCAQIPRRASVVIVSGNVASQFSQVIRGMCGVPVASMAGQPATAVNTVLAAIGSAGRRPVVLAATAGRLNGFGGTPVRVLDLATASDPHQLTQLPTAPGRVRFRVWMTLPPAASVGA